MVPIETKVCHVPTCMAIVQNIYKHELEYHSESLPTEVVNLLKINSIAKEKEIFIKKRKIQNDIRSNHFEKRKRSPSPVAPKVKFGEKHLKKKQLKATSIPAIEPDLHIPTKKNSILGQFYRTVESDAPSPVREPVTEVDRFSESNIKVETASSSEMQSLNGILNSERNDLRSNNSKESSTPKKKEKRTSKNAKKETQDLESLSFCEVSEKRNKSSSGLQIKEENVNLKETSSNSNTIELPEKVRKKKKNDKSSFKNKKRMILKSNKMRDSSLIEELSEEPSVLEEQNNSVTSSTAMEIPEFFVKKDPEVPIKKDPDIPIMEVPEVLVMQVPKIPVMASLSETPSIHHEFQSDIINDAEGHSSTSAIAVKEEISPISTACLDVEKPPKGKGEPVEDSDEDIILLEEVEILKSKMICKTESAPEKNNYDDLITDFILSENIVAALSQCRQNSSLNLSLSTCQIIRQIILVILYLKVLNFEALISMRVCDFMCPKHLESYVLIEPSVESMSDFKPIKLLKSHYKYIRNFIVSIRPKLSSDPYGLLFGQEDLNAEEAKKIFLTCWVQSDLNFNIKQLF